MRLFFLLITVLFTQTVPADDQIANPYASIDAHALAAPPEAETSITGLASYLTRPARNDEEKSRAIYRWMTDRINYDADAYLRNRLRHMDAAEVLKSRTSICSGYARLFETLGSAAGLEIVTIRGYAKGYSFVPGTVFDIPNHEWNAVRIGGTWRFVDSTWGAGYVKDGRYIREFSENYFLTSPEAFIFTHLPVSETWQLQSTPHLGKAEFESLPVPGSAFFNLGIRGETAWNAIHATDFRSEFVSTFDTPLHLVSVKRAPLAHRLAVGESQHWTIESTAFEKMALMYRKRWIEMDKESSRFDASVTPDEQGELLVLGKKPDDDSYVAILGYVVN